MTSARKNVDAGPHAALSDLPHAISADAVAAALVVDPIQGLSAAEVERRAQAAGPNALESERRPRIWRMVLESATQPFVLLLLAAGVGAVLLGKVRDGLLVLAGLIPIVGADVVTEYRGERALEALRAASAPRARVRRDGRVVDVAASEIVTGDIVLVRVGDIVPADLRLTRVDRLVVDRSVLTGESIPEPGVVEPDEPEEALADRRSMAYSGMSVVGGRGEGIVTAIGRTTEIGRIAGGLTTKERRRSPLQRELDRLVRILLVVAIALIAVTTGLGFLRGNPIGDNVLAGISAAIAAIPEEPPILLAVVLGLGAYRLLRRGVLVRRLNAEEILGAVDLVITDKTGTLTQNRLEVASVYGRSGSVADPTRRLEFLTLGLRAEDDAWVRGEGIGTSSFTSALARAVEAHGGNAHPDPDDLIATDPVEDRRPYTSTTARRDGRVETLFLGAPEAVADLALGPDGADRRAWHERIEAATASGERVVGLARRDDTAGDPSMVALIGFADALRPEIPEATTAAHEAGIQVIVVTGDHPRTAGAIARQAGIDIGRVVLGSELERWSDEDLAARLRGITVIARSTPDQKRRIVEVARRAGRLVAVTGDGVNDAPALHGADVAVSMGSGTAVAKGASDLVLGDDSFATLIYGIGEGRRMVDNVQKGLVFLISTHVALLGFILIATLAGFSQPLLPIQILWLELFIDITASVAFEREPAEPDLMVRKPRAIAQPLLSGGLLGRIALAGGFSAVAALWLMTGHGGALDHARWLAYTTLVCAQAVRAYANRSLREPLQRLRWNPVLLGVCILTVAVQALIPLIPPIADAFRATPLDAIDWLLVAIIALAPAIVAESIRALRQGPWVA
ncbi:MAG TPA: HAD-IC family P-type ATPase [Candidatus Limnocylindrales bacterium]|nr:HAD-IC family P-type ATPase [Candidatus Limnocylindrales bacterium]